jgi:integrase
MPKKGIGLYKRKDGRWEGQYYYDINPKNGRRKKLSRYGKTEKEAKEKLLTAMDEIKSGTYVEKSKLTLESWLSQWLEVYARPKVKQSTYVNYRTYITKHTAPEIGKLKLSDLRIDLLQQFFNEKAKHGRLDGKGGLSDKTLRNMYTMFSTALKQAYENSLISKNFIEFVKLPKVPQKEMRVLSLAEEQKLLLAIKVSKERYKVGVLICLCTGIRVGELCGLQWCDIRQGLYGFTMSIRRTLNRLPAMDRSKKKTELVIGTPKSDKSIRDIPLPQFLMDDLAEYRKQREAEKSVAGDVYDKRGFIICNEIGRPVESRTMQDVFKRLLKTAGVAKANFHALRHTFATRAVESGVDIKTLSELLGHADVSITLNRYAHSFDEQKRKAMAMMAGIYK